MSGSTENAPGGTLGLETGLEALESSDEFRGPVEPIAGTDSNDHLALLYESRAEQLEAAVPFVRQGLENGERCMYVCDDGSKPAVIDGLAAAGIDVDAAVESGALSFHTVDETYLHSGTFDPDEMIEFYADAIEEATEEYDALRVTAETSWLREEGTSVDKFLEYESKVNDLFTGTDCIALCQYDRTQFRPAVVRDIVTIHPHVVYDGAVCQNVYYTPPEEFLGEDEPANDVDRMLGVLRDRTVAKTSLSRNERFLRRLYETVADPESTFEEKVERLLELGSEYLEVDVGFLSHVDGEDFEIVDAVGSHELIQRGATTATSETYCRQVLDSEGPFGVHDARAEDLVGETAYERYGLESFLGVTVTAGATPYGTLCFADEAARDEPFSKGQQTFVELMGEWLSYELDRRQRERELRERKEYLNALVETTPECIKTVAADGTLLQMNPAGLEMVEADESVIGECVYDVIAPEHRERFREFNERICSGESGTLEFDVVGLEGTRRHMETHAAPLYRPDGTVSHVALTRDVTDSVERAAELRERERRLSALNGLSRELMEPKTAAETSERVVAAAEETLDLPVAAVAIDDPETGALKPAAATDAGERLLEAAPLLDVGEGVCWEAFVNDAPRRRSDPLADVDAASAPPVTEVAAFPLGKHGVFVVGSTSDDGFAPSDYDFVETVAANTGAAIGRAGREQQLRSREETLEERTETLARLDRINTIIRSIDQALVGASSRAEIQRVVCEELAGDGPYELAWVGDYDGVTGTITPAERAGSGQGYLDEIDVTAEGDVEDLEPAGRAIRTGEPQVVDEMLDDPPFDPWRQAALNRGYQSAVALPLTRDDSQFGVLGVYAGDAGVFDDLERAVLTELSDTISYAMSAVKNKRALVSDEVTELVFEVPGEDLEIVEFVRETGCEFRFENAVPRAEGGLRGFFHTRGVAPGEVEAASSRLPVRELSLVSERDDGERTCLFEAVLDSESLAATVLDHGGRVEEIHAEDGVATVTVEVAAGSSVREFVEMFHRKYSGATLSAKRTRERPQETLSEFHAALTDDLTLRQLEALRTAFHSGYFETPRERTGSEVAASMDISQPTLNNHLRAAQRKLYGKLFEAGSPLP